MHMHYWVAVLTITGLYLHHHYDFQFSPRALLFILLVSILFIIKEELDEPYGLFHLPFNKRPGEPVGVAPRTEWLNMGFWKDADNFPDAAEALALKVIRAAQLKSGSHVLDVGHGTGESIITLLSNPSVPRPSRVTGITDMPLHRERSEMRVERLQASTNEAATQVELLLGDAVCRAGVTTHPFLPESPVVFDAVLALDCAYHFDTRWTFLEQAYTKLIPGGRVALADMSWEPSKMNTLYSRVLFKLVYIVPLANITSSEDYMHRLSSMGYEDVQLEDITEHVHPGFIRFLQGSGFGWWIFAMVMSLFFSTGARYVIVSGRKP